MDPNDDVPLTLNNFLHGQRGGQLAPESSTGLENGYSRLTQERNSSTLVSEVYPGERGRE